MIEWIDIKDETPKDYAYKESKAPVILFCLHKKYIKGGYFLEERFFSDDGNWYEIEEITHWAECNIP